jgi:8-oxo-dGTP diphosphatase
MFDMVRKIISQREEPQQVRRFRVGSALIIDQGALLLVGNRRRQGHLEWTPPGGVIEGQEAILAGIAREVKEEIGLTIRGWQTLQYSVEVNAPDMGWQMSVQSWRASGTSGSLVFADPDEIVEEARSVPLGDVAEFLVDAPAWIQIPVISWLQADCQPVGSFSFILRGADRSTARVEQIET